MSAIELRRLPAAPVSLGLIGGVAVASTLPDVPCVPWIALATLVAAPCVRRVSVRLAILLITLSALFTGAGLELRDRNEFAARERGADLPADGTGVEVHLRARVVSPAEPALDGERILYVRGRIESDGAATGPTLTIRLRMLPSAEAAVRTLDGLDAGDEIRVWCRIRIPRPRNNPGARGSGLRSRGLDAVGTAKSARLVERVARGEPGPRRWAGRARRAARQRLDRLLGEGTPVRAMAGALLLGERAALDPDSIQTLRRSGLMHVVAISGMHVGLIVLAVFELLRRAPVGPWCRFALLAFFLAGFSLFVGPRSSVQRAALAAGGVLLGRSIGRDGDGRNALMIVAAVLVAESPAVLADAGFRLTFLATAGILALARPIAAGLPFPAPLGTGIGVSAGAYLATAPVVAWHFGLLAPIGIVAGLFALPLCAAALIGGYAAILLSAAPGISVVLAGLAGAACDGLLRVAGGCASIPLGAFVVSAPGTSTLIAAYGAWISLLLLPGGARRRTVACAALAGLALAWVHAGPRPTRSSGRTEVEVLDVGQGLSVAVRGPEGGVLLIDAGGSHGRGFDPGERIVVPSLLAGGSRRVDALVVSHDHLDHVGGAFAVVRDLEVGELWLGPGHSGSARLAALVALARSRGVAVVLAEEGTWGRARRIPFRIVAPSRERLPEDPNARSLVVLAGVAPARLLVPGDIEKAVELELLGRHSAIRAEALVLAHHGSRHASGAAFLEAVAADLAMASAGRGNPFGHPHRETLQRVAAAGARLVRTDRHGFIRLIEQPDGWLVAP